MKHINVALFVTHRGCPHTCSFCNQRSITGFGGDLTPADVHAAVETALGSLKKEEAAGGEIAFFGGSFTMVEREYMLSLLEAAYGYVKEGLFAGIRISTRPDGINDEICGILRSYGVTAVELGAQSLDDRVLELNERGHTAKQVEDACKMIKAYGFELGLQMMTGLYGSGDEDSIETAKKIIALRPATVRIYPTVVLRGTKLDELMKAGIFTPKGVEETANENVILVGKIRELMQEYKQKIRSAFGAKYNHELLNNLFKQADVASRNLLVITTQADSAIETVTGTINEKIALAENAMQKISEGAEKTNELITTIENDSLYSKILYSSEMADKVNELVTKLNEIVRAIDTKGIKILDENGNPVKPFTWKNFNLIGKTARAKARERAEKSNTEKAEPEQP